MMYIFARFCESSSHASIPGIIIGAGKILESPESGEGYAILIPALIGFFKKG